MREKRNRVYFFETCMWCRCPLPLSNPDNYIDDYVLVNGKPVSIKIHKECLPHLQEAARKSA